MLACLVDTHVHLYPSFDPAAVLAATLANTDRFAPRLGLAAPVPTVLFLTQTAAERPPSEVFAAPPPGWTVKTVDPLGTLRLSGAGEIYIVPGWQVVSREGLEVLALGSGAPPEGGKPAADILAGVEGQGALAVLPWGIGKWTGERGRILRQLMADPAHSGVFLGDNAGRLRGRPRPALLAEGEALGLKVLPGSDPLPVAGEEAKIARLLAKAELDPADPTESLKTWLRNLSASPETTGTTDGLWSFLRLQTTMQIRKRLG